MSLIVKERPILFSGPMVRAILEGRKTQTRRVLKNNHFAGGDCGPESLAAASWCPYGIPGDRLWVRETWAIADCGSRVSTKAEAWPKGFPIDRLEYPVSDTKYFWNKRSSRFMPRWASRILLEVTDVRVQRVQEISSDDARWEGVEDCHENGHDDCFYGTHGWRCSFERLWNSINAKRGFGWAENPWVWAVSFKVIQTNGSQTGELVR